MDNKKNKRVLSFEKTQYRRRQKHAAVVFLAGILLLCFLVPVCVSAEVNNEKETIRVGFFAFDGYHRQDEDGCKDGYGYDFLQMIAPYANFQYEYVGYDKSWPEMTQMLLDGEIDLLTAAKKTPEREEMFEFSEKSIGSSFTMLTTLPDNIKYTASDYSTLEGIRVGLLENDISRASFEEYAAEHSIDYIPVYYDKQDKIEEALQENKDVDAIVTSDLRTLENEIIIDKFDERQFYVITDKGNTELMERVNSAISRLSQDSPDWIYSLMENYYNRSVTGRSMSLTTEEIRYVDDINSQGKKLKVLVNPDRAPYSYFENGTPKGIMVDLLSIAAEKSGIPYEIIETANTKEYSEKIQLGEADIVFDAAFDYDIAEKAGYYLTKSYYSLIYARVTRNNDNTKDDVVAVKTTDAILMDRYPALFKDKEIVYCDTIDECMKMVESGNADYTYVFNYTASKYVGADYTNSFAYEIMSGISCPVSAAVRSGCGMQLYSVVSKVVGSITSEQRQAVISKNTQYDVTNSSISYFIYNKPVMVIFIVVLIMATIVGMILWFRERERKAEKLYREKEARQKAALREAFEAADRANHAKTDFLSGMSHDIRTPLNAIIGMIAIASAHIDDRNRVADCLAKITASSRHLLGLINEVLDMSRIESGKITLTEEEFNLANLIDNLIELVQPGIKAKKHELIVRIHNIDHEEVLGDSLRLQQAFVNIVGNATKYTPAGGKIEIEISELESKTPRIGTYKFVFKDNGIGMSKEFVKTIFEPFSREKDSRVNKIQGSGLGMAITKNLVQMMDGSITVESEQGKGSVFTVIIRLKLQAGELTGDEDFIGLPILVVDDDLNICESTCLILNEIGMDSEFVQTGMEAVEKVKESHAKEEDYYAVIIDWKMPDMDGLTTTRAIREAVGSDVPIIIFSAYDWSDIEKEARAAGVNAFVSKPLFRSKLIHAFDEIIHKDKRREETHTLETFERLDFSGRRVLLVEDNELNREIACEIIGASKITIDMAENGEEAVRKFYSSSCNFYDLILMDIQMPLMNGYDAAMAIRAMDRPDAKSIPIVAMTADAFAEDVEKAMAAQMNEHLAKPLDIQKLADVMTRWLDR